MHTIDIKEEVAAGHTSFSKGLLTPNGYFDYTRFGKKLELLGDEKIIFKKALKKVRQVYNVVTRRIFSMF